MSEIRVDTISEKTSANGVSIDGLTIKDGGITATTGAIVFNEASADVDFRVESNGNANMLFVDGGNDKVGIGTGSPFSKLHIGTRGSADVLTYSSSGDGILFDFYNLAGSPYTRYSNIVSSSSDTSESRLGFWTQAASGTSSEKISISGNGNVTFAAGLLIGGTGAANTLDDYEEGTWTPAWDSGANGRSISGTGGYTKVGNLVTVFGYFEIGGSDNTGSGDVSFSGLPFTSSSVTAQRSAISIFVNKCASAVDGYISGFVQANTQIFFVREGGIVANGADLGNHFDQDTDFYMSASYRV